MHKKVRVRNSKYKTTKFDFQVVMYFIIALLFSLASIYFVYFIAQLGFSSVYSVMGGWGFVLVITLIFLSIMFWVITFQTFNNVNLYNTFTKFGQISVEYVEFSNEGVVVCENSRKFKIDYSDIKSVDFLINASVTSNKYYYLNFLNLNISYNSEEELKNIEIIQEPTFMIVDKIYDILYFSQRCPNFSLKFPNEDKLRQTTFGKAITSYFDNNCHHTFRSFMQTSKGMSSLFIIVVLLILIIIGGQFI